MFDFVNYTYSGLVAIFAAVIGLGCPLIITRIRGTDEQYGSTLLTQRFTHEVSFRVFVVAMLVNIVMVITLPFIIETSAHARVWIAVLSSVVLIFLVSLVLLFSDMLEYASPKKLSARILEDFHNAQKKGRKKEEELYFFQWVDLTPILLVSADYELTQSVYTELYAYIEAFYSGKGEKDKFDNYFLIGVTRINELLCQKEQRLITVNNSNTILALFITNKHSIPVAHYQVLWKNLVLQAHHDKDEWIMSYWETASQRQQMRKYNSDYAIDAVERREVQEETMKREDWEFLEFHIALVAMLLQKGKHGLVKRMLSFSNSQPQEYPLVPSTVADILSAFNKINQTSNAPGAFLYYETRFAMPDMHGISDGKILGAIYSYLTLLFYRLYALPWYYGSGYVLRNGIRVDNTSLAELHTWRDSLQIIRFWLKKVEADKELLKIVDYSDSEISERQESQYGRVATPEQIIKDAETVIENAEQNLKENQPYGESKVIAMYGEIVRILQEAIQPYLVFANGNSKQEQLVLNCSTAQPYPNAAFVEDPDVSYVNIEETIAHMVVNHFSFEICKLFYMRCHGKSYRIVYEDLIKAIEKLQLSNQYVILAFGHIFENIAESDSRFEVKSDTYWRFKGMDIYEIPNSGRLLDRTLYIIKKADLPNLQFSKPVQEQIEKYRLDQKDKKYEIWASLLRLKDHPELQEKMTQIEDHINEYALFTLGWQPRILVKSEIDAIKIKVLYRFIDEGNPDDVETIEVVGEKNTEIKETKEENEDTDCL